MISKVVIILQKITVLREYYSVIEQYFINIARHRIEIILEDIAQYFALSEILIPWRSIYSCALFNISIYYRNISTSGRH